MFLFIFLLFSCNSVEEKKDKVISIKESNLIYRYKNNSSEFYSYPKGANYKRGDFKLESFEIRQDNDGDYLLVIEIDNMFRNHLMTSKGWDLQVFDIYLFTDFGSHTQSIDGRKVKFSSSWEKSILVSPHRDDLLQKEVIENNVSVYDDVSDLENISSDIYVADRITVSGNMIYVTLPGSDFSSIVNRLNGVQVLISNYDPYPLKDKSSIREVKEKSSNWHFGGGSYSLNSPNVISILGDVNQLNSFEDSITKRVYATVDAISVK